VEEVGMEMEDFWVKIRGEKMKYVNRMKKQEEI